MAREQGADDGAQTIEHPVLRAGGNTLAEAARDEIDEEENVRDETHGVESVLQDQRPRRLWLAVVLHRMRRGVWRACLLFPGPIGPTDQGQKGRQYAKPIPALR